MELVLRKKKRKKKGKCTIMVLDHIIDSFFTNIYTNVVFLTILVFSDEGNLNL